MSLWLCLQGKFFKWKIYKSQEKKKFLDICLRKNRYQVFMNYSHILPIWQILFLFLFASFGIHELFLFLFVRKLAPRIYSCSYLREKLLFANHWHTSGFNKALALDFPSIILLNTSLNTWWHSSDTTKCQGSLRLKTTSPWTLRDAPIFKVLAKFVRFS